MFRSSSLRVVFAAGLLAAFAGQALALDDQKPGNAPLSGPKVKDNGVPGEGRRFGGGTPAGKEARDRGIPHRAFMRALESLKDGPLAPSSEQEAKVREIDAKFREAQREYAKKHQDEVRGLMNDLPPGPERRRVAEMLRGIAGEGGPKGDGKPGEGRERRRGPGGPGGPPEGDRGPGKKRGPGGPDAPPPGEMMEEGAPPSPEKAQAAKARLRELFDGAPKAEDVHAQMFGVLSAEQKAAVEKELAEMREEMGRRRAGEQAEDMQREGRTKGTQKSPDQANPDAPKGQGWQGADRAQIRELMQSLPAEERAKIQNMSPEERRAYIRKLLDERKK